MQTERGQALAAGEMTLQLWDQVRNKPIFKEYDRKENENGK
jgi:hypothetical protein